MNWKPMYFQSCPKGLCRCSSLCVKWNSPPLFPPTVFLFSISSSCTENVWSCLFFLHTSWTETAKKECMQNILRYSTILGQQPWKPAANPCPSFPNPGPCLQTSLQFILSDCCSFVLCPFVKLFLNVYTWFSNCLFCTFNFIIKQCKLSPWCLEDHIV